MKKLRIKLSAICVLSVIALGIISASFSNLSASGLGIPPDAGIQFNDTIKMVSGVPLKPNDISPLLTGEKIPFVKMQNAAGENIDLNAMVAAKPTILVFYRGGWCPYCNKQLSGLQEIESKLRETGYQIIAVSTDSPENLAKTGAKQKLTYTLLSDADLQVSKQFGIAFKAPKNYDKFLPEASGGKNNDKLLPVPAVFILSRKGNIAFEYINPDMTQRISGDLLMAAATAIVKDL